MAKKRRHDKKKQDRTDKPVDDSASRQDHQADLYRRHRERMARRQQEQTRSGRDIGPLPEIANPQARRKAAASLKFFCEHYLAEAFTLAFSPHHLALITAIENATWRGELAAIGMPRGSGKTTLCLAGLLWATICGHVHFATIIAARNDRSKELLEAIKTWCETNPRLIADFPELCYPVTRLERSIKRQTGQTCGDTFTRMEWSKGKIVFPTIEGSDISGTIITCCGLEGSGIRGQFHITPTGEIRRPELVLIDDPQTRESAWSELQCQQRLQLLAADVLGMAGPGKQIAGLITCTVIRGGDVADVILDRHQHPQWHGRRVPMLLSEPTDMTLWERYNEVRIDSLKNDQGIERANAFYAEHRGAMDAGAEVYWPARRREDELSAIQHAMNLKLQDEAAFASEYQNQPLQATGDDDDDLTLDDLHAALNQLPHGVVPIDAQAITAYIDVQQHLLYYLVCGWREGFGGVVIDYGTFPEQRNAYFTARAPDRVLAEVTGSNDFEASLYQGLVACVHQLADRSYTAEDDTLRQISRILIDANWGKSTDVVYRACRGSDHRGMLLPAHGRYVGASSKPLNEARRSPGDVIGRHWKIASSKTHRGNRYATYDTNHWKSFVHARMKLGHADASSIALWGKQPGPHRLLFDHLTAEHHTRVVSKEREVDEWRIRPQASENHWWDCLVGCAVAASMEGIAAIGQTEIQTGRRRVLTLKDMPRRRKKLG
jgi:hypothetical protein